MDKEIILRNEIIDAIKKDYRKKINDLTLKIFIFGEGFPKGMDCWVSNNYEKCERCEKADCIGARRRILLRKVIEESLGHIAIFPEELKFIYPAIDEKNLLKEKEVDMAMILPEGPGAISEFSDFSSDHEIAFKLRVFVPKKFHPLEHELENMEPSYLTNAYLIHLTLFGHVYAFENNSDLIKKVILIIESYRRIKYNIAQTKHSIKKN